MNRKLKYFLIILALTVVSLATYLLSTTNFPAIGGNEPWAYITTDRRMDVGFSGWEEKWEKTEWPFSKPEGFETEFSARYKDHEMWVASFHYSSAEKALTSFDKYLSRFPSCKKVDVRYAKTCKNTSELICLPGKTGHPIIYIRDYRTFECENKIIHMELTGNSIFVAIASKTEEEFMQEALAITLKK